MGSSTGQVRRRNAKSANGPSVWALCAVSSEAQAETLAHQRRWAEEVAEAHAWRLTRVIEGVASGKAGPRRIVRELLADLRALEPEARPSQVLMIRADRLGRGSIIESQIVLRDLLELGVGVYTRDQGQIKLDSAMDELISAATLAVARHENEVKREKQLAVYRRKRAAGEIIGTRTPYGLERKNGKYVPDKKRGPIVREAFRMRLQGKGYNAIGARLAAIAPPHQYLRPSKKHPNGESVVHWSANRVSKLLKNRAYIGPIVSEADFAKAQRVASALSNAPRDGKPTTYQWPLSGAIRCYCGSSMSGIPCGAYPYRYRYYACKSRWNHDNKLRLVRADDLEEQFVDILRRLRASPKLIERYRQRAAAPVKPQLLERSIRELKAKLAEIGRKRDLVWEHEAAGKIRAEDCQERLDRLAAQREDFEGRLRVAQEQIAIAKAASERNRDVADLFKRAAVIFQSATEPEQRTISRAVSLELGGLTINSKGLLTVGR